MYNAQLDTFIAAAESGSFTKAADWLFISAPAVIKQINALEHHLNMKLFDRSPRGITLTDAGRSIYKDAIQIIKFSNDAVNRARIIIKNQPYVIRIGNSMMNPCRPLMKLWKKISGEFPKMKMQIIPYDDNASVVLNVLDTLGKDFDFIVAPCNSNKWLERCSFFQIGTYKICCAVPHDHPLSSKKIIEPHDLAGQTLMMCEEGDSPILDGIRNYLHTEFPQINIEDTSIFYDASVLNRCEQDGKILLTLDAWEDVHPFLHTVEINWDFTMPYGIVYPKEPPQSVLLFLEAVKRIVNIEPGKN